MEDAVEDFLDAIEENILSEAICAQRLFLVLLDLDEQGQRGHYFFLFYSIGKIRGESLRNCLMTEVYLLPVSKNC